MGKHHTSGHHPSCRLRRFRPVFILVLSVHTLAAVADTVLDYTLEQLTEPLKLGAEWEYELYWVLPNHHYEGRADISIVGKETIGGREYHKVLNIQSGYPGARVHTNFHRSSDNGFHVLYGAAQEMGEQLTGPFPIRIHETWNTKEPNYLLINTLEGLETVEVRGRVYTNALRIARTMKTLEPPHEAVAEGYHFFYPGVGYLTSHMAGVGVHEGMEIGAELVRYTPGPREEETVGAPEPDPSVFDEAWLDALPRTEMITTQTLPGITLWSFFTTLNADEVESFFHEHLDDRWLAADVSVREVEVGEGDLEDPVEVDAFLVFQHREREEFSLVVTLTRLDHPDERLSQLNVNLVDMEAVRADEEQTDTP